MTRPDIPVTIGGDPRGFESALSRVRNAARSTAGDVAAAFSRLKSIGGGAIGLAGAFGLTAFVQAAKTAADAVANIGDEARRAGLSAKVFQEWKYVAEQARIPVDAITDGLKELQLRADEFAVTGKGSAAEAFERLGLTPQQVKEKLQNPSELLLLLIERTRQLKDTAAGIRIFDELFGGTGGERMVALIEQGEAGIRSQIKAAHDFGNVLSDDVIAKAQEIDRQFNAISVTVGNNLKSAIVSVVGSMVDFLDSLRAVENQRAGTIQGSINDIMRQKQEVAKAMAAADSADSKLNDRQRAKAKGTHEIKMRQLDEEENRLIRELESRPQVMNFQPKSSDAFKPAPYTPPPQSGGSKKSSGGPKPNEYERETQLIQKRTEALNATTSAQSAVNPLINDYGYAVEYAAAKQELLTAAQEAGVKITPELTQSIDGLASGYANAVVAAEQLSEKQDEIRQRAEDAMATAKDVTRGVIDGFMDGAKAADILTGSLKKIGNALIDDVLSSIFKVNAAGSSGGGLLSGILGLFGGGSSFAALPSVGPVPAARPGFSGGGWTGPGGRFQPAGEVHKGEYVFDQDSVRAAGGPSALDELRRRLRGYSNGGLVSDVPPPPLPSLRSGGVSDGSTAQASSQPLTVVVDVRGATGNSEIQEMVAAGVQQGIAVYDKQMPDRVQQINRHPRRR